MAGDEAKVPQVKSLACAGCGAPLTVRGFGQTETIVCASCGTAVDLEDESVRVLSAAKQKLRIEPLIPLGSRGTLLGEPLEVIGYMRRRVVVEGVPYEWGEYLLFNPYKGFRWLNEYNGHWTFIRTMLERPALTGGSPRYLDRPFKHFQTANAEVTYVVGEFHWRVAVGEQAHVEDYVAPPYLLSRESTGNEIVWSLGQYVDRNVVEKAFGVVKLLPFPVGVAPCQPRPLERLSTEVYPLFFWFAVAAFAVQLLTSMISRNELAFRGRYNYHPLDVEKSYVSDLFELRGRTSNVVVKSHADVSNDWIYLNLALIDEASGHAYDFGREISYYSGTDSDGAWTEGSRDDSAVIAAVPPGRYYLRIEPEGSQNPVPYEIAVYRDVPRWRFFFGALVVLAIVPIVVFWRRSAFEIRRWAESDHPIVTTD